MAVNYQEIARYMGIVNKPINSTLKADIDKCILDIKKINPIKLTAEYEIEHTENGITLKGTEIEFKGELIKNSLSGCNKIYLIIATLTIEAEKLLSSYSANNMYLAVILDACLTYSIEEYCDKIEQEIKDNCSKDNHYTTPRFSAGYGDFDIEYQKTIIKLLNADKYLGIRVNNENMLTPNKTVTAIIGIRNKAEKIEKTKCKGCDKACIYRDN